MKKKVLNMLYWILLGLMGIFFSYQKGWIFANFKSVDAKEAYRLIEEDKNLTLLDVRTPEEFKLDGYILGAKLIPVGQLSKKLSEVDKSKKVLVYCRSGSRSVAASRLLSNSGFVVLNLSGGMNSWSSSGFVVEKK